MALLVDNMHWVLLCCGLLTCTMIQAVFAPRYTMRAYFGEVVDSPAARMLMRNWGALVAFGGALLIYAAYTPVIRPPVLLYVGAGKLVFILLILSQPRQFFRGQAVTAVILDGLMVALFAAYLLATLEAPNS
jgi:hypothetical protein